jgi:hypothetical protein
MWSWNELLIYGFIAYIIFMLGHKAYKKIKDEQ